MSIDVQGRVVDGSTARGHNSDGLSYDAADDEVIRRGQQAWTNLKAHLELDWEHWKAVGRALFRGRHLCMLQAYTNKPVGRRYNEIFGHWLVQHGFDLDHTTRAHLLKVMDHLDAIEEWRTNLPTTERLYRNHPSVCFRKWRRASRREESEEQPKPTSRVAQLKEENARLRREIERGGGDLWNNNDRPEDIAVIMMAKLSDSKVERVARAILQKLKEKRERAASAR